MTIFSPIPPITEENIAEFLLQTPEFFDRHAEVLVGVQLTSPHGHRAVSLQERQAEMLRDKIKGLEQHIMEIVRNSHDNTAIANKLHLWGCALQRVTPPGELPDAVVRAVCAEFDVSQAAIRVWDVAAPYLHAPYAQGVDSDVRAFASSLTTPFCGPNLGFGPAAWLPGGGVAHADGSGAQSLALLPLRDGPVDSATPAFGLLVLASHDPLRFDASLGVEFLSRMAEMASAALTRIR